jgi:hypothetical protein
MNVEQHILYSMYTKKERKERPITVDVQLYVPGTQKVIVGNPWFYLGYLMYHEIHLNTTYNTLLLYCNSNFVNTSGFPKNKPPPIQFLFPKIIDFAVLLSRSEFNTRVTHLYQNILV